MAGDGYRVVSREDGNIQKLRYDEDSMKLKTNKLYSLKSEINDVWIVFK